MNKESLNKLLVFVIELSEQKENIWFKDALSQQFGNSNSKKDSIKNFDIERKIDLINEYLSIDFGQVIDYSSFDKPVSLQLTRDCIEMLRYQTGANHYKKDFYEFCRFAHLQAEEMLNYYFVKKFKNPSEIEKIIKSKYEKYKIRDVKNVSEISFFAKYNAFKSIYNKSRKTFYAINLLNSIRNDINHRSTLTKKNEDEILDKAKAKWPDILIKKIDSVSDDPILFFEAKKIQSTRIQDYDYFIKELADFCICIQQMLNDTNEVLTSKSLGSSNDQLAELKRKLEGEK